jgi:hypothetical protein
MVKSINSIGQFMGKKTIAEFVESRAIRERLCKIGVDDEDCCIALPRRWMTLQSEPAACSSQGIRLGSCQSAL